MQAGKLDRRITIQRKTVTQRPSGEPIESWSTLATVWASATQPSGDERFSNPQLIATGAFVFGIRWSQTVASVGPLDRISYDGRQYDIRAVRETLRRRWLEIDATARTDR